MMKKEFLGADFLLDTPAAVDLYNKHAARQPIIDYHCHLSPKMIADNERFASITELWLGGDHYKWRAMRANGVAERYVTGDASDWEKFEKWAETVPYTLRNPLYHWTHMELRTAFGITDVLNGRSARSIYDRCNELLADDSMTPRGLMRHYGVETVCTTDDPVDSLQYHKAIADSGFEIKVLPTWRPDKAMAVDSPAEYANYLQRLGESADTEINSYASLIEALRKRHDYFASVGCRLADHGVGEMPGGKLEAGEECRLFDKVVSGKILSKDDADKLKFAILLDLARMNHEKGWAQQIHFGPMRNVNSKMYRMLGPDTGFDTIGDYRAAERLCSLLDTLESENALTKTILYNLNPADNVWVAAMAANFQDGTTPGKMQYGAAWWFNDHLAGMEAQINSLSQQGLLSRFVGMLTDSRSFLSYTRHDYFRRLLCSIVGRDITEGLIPEAEKDRVEGMIEDICYNNAKRYFEF